MATRLVILAIAAAVLLSGCAFLNRDNTPLLNLVEEHLWPESTGMRVLVAPVVYPVGFVAITVDAAVVHPVSVVGEAVEETGDILWDNWDWEHQYLTECAALPWRAIGTPIVFTSSFLARAMFDVKDRAEEERKKELARPEATARAKALEAEVEKAEALFAAGKTSAALDRALALFPKRGESRLERHRNAVARLVVVTLEAAHRSGRYHVLFERELLNALASFPGRTPEILTKMQGASSPLARWTALQIVKVRVNLREPREAMLRRALGDAEPLIRYGALQAMMSNRSDRRFRRFEDEVGRMAERDPDPLVKAYARRVLESGGG